MKSLPPFTVALIRAIIGAVIMAGVFYFANDVALFSKQVLGIAFGFVALRAGAEGWYDQATKPRQNQPPATDFDGPRV